MDFARRRGPAKHRRHRAGRAADDDVLRRGGFQYCRIDHRIADERGQRQPHRERVDEHVQQIQAGPAHHAGKHQCLGAGQFAARQRTGACTRHHRVDFLFDQAIERCRRAGHQRDPERAGPQRIPARPAGYGEEHADHCREHDQADDTQLAQGQKLLATAGRALNHQGFHAHLLRTR